LNAFFDEFDGPHVTLTSTRASGFLRCVSSIDETSILIRDRCLPSKNERRKVNDMEMSRIELKSVESARRGYGGESDILLVAIQGFGLPVQCRLGTCAVDRSVMSQSDFTLMQLSGKYDMSRRTTVMCSDDGQCKCRIGLKPIESA
jgi:hypothetical protein